MTIEEAIKILDVAKAECEWSAPLDYQVAINMAIEALKAQDVPEINVGDMISRQGAIDAVKKHYRIDNDLLELIVYEIEQLSSAQSKHNQNTMSKQPDSETLGIKTEETCEDVISRQDTIDGGSGT